MVCMNVVNMHQMGPKLWLDSHQFPSKNMSIYFVKNHYLDPKKKERMPRVVGNLFGY